jgi:4-amino-4-deoxy-L-arabinose transferase-like glycosyltransferase
MHQSPVSTDDRRAVWIQTIAWAVVVVIAAAVLAGFDYRTRDPDSALHADIVSDLARKPIEGWLAPEWGGHWNRQGWYREHPPGLFLLSMPLVWLGCPAPQAPFVVNAVFQILCLLLLQRLARVFATNTEARAVGWLLQLMPIAFVFRIRANHEQLVLFFYLAALLTTEKARTRPSWFGATAFATVGAVLVKGVFAAIVPLSCSLWLLWRPAATPSLRRVTWAGIGLVVAVAAGSAAWYEYAYRAITSESFFGFYATQQLGLAAHQRADTAILMVAQKLGNLGWYVGRVLWFAFPWGLILLPLLVPRVRRAWNWNAAMTRELGLLLALAAMYVGVLSLSDRRADRYAFPAYYIVGLLGAVVSMRSVPHAGRIARALERVYPFEHVMVWAITFVLALAPLWNRIPKFKLINNY